MKTAIFLAEGFEEVEALTVVDLLRRAEIPIDMVSISSDKTVISSHKVPVEADKLIQEVDLDTYDMLILPGGIPGTPNLEACPKLMEALDCFYEQGKCISAICAAPSIFGHRGFLKGRRACSHPSVEDQLEGAQVQQEPMVVSDFITTGRGMGAAIDFGLAIVERYKGRETADNIAGAIIYRR